MRNIFLVALLVFGLGPAHHAFAKEAKQKSPVPFVMQMTTEDPLLQRRAFMQIAKVL